MTAPRYSTVLAAILPYTVPTNRAELGRAADKPVALFSDLAVHNMGPALADDISQGIARGDEFRTAPLWGPGKRIFLLYDGRTSHLLAAIGAHSSQANSHYPASEANTVIGRFNNLNDTAKAKPFEFSAVAVSGKPKRKW